jgi:hypothetical protein
MAAAFGMDRVVGAVLAKGTAAAGQMTKPALGIFGVLLAFHIIEGAAEMAVSPSSCRLWHGQWWLRIILVAALLAGYQGVVVGTVAQLQPQYMTNFAMTWNDVWDAEANAIDNLKQAEAENRDVKYSDVSQTKSGKDDDSWYAKLGRYAVDGLLTGLGWLLAVIVGLMITVFILMEGFTALGLNMLLLAIGPVCIAFAAHPKTESYAWSFLKAFVFMALLYMPLLGLAAQFAGIVMAQMTTFVAGSGLAYGDGTDICVHYLWVIFGPLCALAVVKSAPMFLSMVLGSGSGGAGAAGVAGLQLMRPQDGGGGGGGSPPPPDMPQAPAGGAKGEGSGGGSGSSGGGSSGPMAAEMRGETVAANETGVLPGSAEGKWW